MRSKKLWMRLGWAAAFGLALAAGSEKYTSLLAPLRERETEALRAVADLSGRIEKAQAAIAEMQAKETTARRVRSELKRPEYDLPTGSALVWLPVMAKENFARSGIAVRLIRLNTIQDEPDISGYERGVWSVVLPVEAAGRNDTKLFLAVAEIEHQNPFVRVLDFAIGPDPEDPGGRVASLNVAALVRK